MARILIGYSACQLTRKAFEAHGHDVYTCDLLPARIDAANDNGGKPKHYQCDVWDVLGMDWDMAVLHPMCTYMNVASVWALKDPDFDRYPGVGYHQKVKQGTLVGSERRAARAADIDNFKRLLELPYPVAIENPAPSSLNTAVRPPDQVVHPHQFGDDASKGTGFWLTNGLPLLTGTGDIPPRWCAQPNGKSLPRWANQTDSGQNRLSPGEKRWLERSQTYPGIAAAMGDQWGRYMLALDNAKCATNDNRPAAEVAA